MLEHFDKLYRMRADGTGEFTTHVLFRIQSEGAAKSLSVLTAFFNAESSNGSIENVRVRKPDGTVVTTPSSESIELDAPITREAPVYSDLKERQLPVRSLAAGDTLEYDFRITYTKPEAPNQFWGGDHFITAGAVVLSQTVTLELPAGKYIQVWSPHHQPTITEHDGLKSYRWQSAQLTPTPAKDADGKADLPKDPDEDSDGRSLPSIAWTTFHSWAEVGDWYRVLATPRAQPTPELRTRADALTVEAKTPEEQIKAIYTFVSEQVRYVGIDFGIGRIQPHFAEATLSNRYGDCKDKDTLLEALLRAKGFHTSPALIGAGIAIVRDLPSPASFNHVITTVMLPGSTNVPAQTIWLDATPGIEPYRMLIANLRDAEALVVPAEGVASLQRTPAEPPYSFLERFRAEAQLDAKGLLTGHMVLDLRSDSEAGYRLLLHNAAPAQWDEAAQNVVSALGFTGTASKADLHQPSPDAPAHLAWDYRRPGFADWANLRIVPLFPTLQVTTIDKDKAPDHDIDQGAPRVLDAVSIIRLPEGYRAELPNAIHVNRPYATFDKTYAVSNSTLTATRRMVVLKQKIAKTDWKDYATFSKEAGWSDGETYIGLYAPVKESASDVAKDKRPDSQPKEDSPAITAETSGADTSVAELMQKAEQQYRRADLSGEKETLLEIQRRAPKTPYLLSMLGYLALQNSNLNEAEADLRNEVEAHPSDGPNPSLLLAGVYERMKQYPKEVAFLKTQESRNDRGLQLMLAHAQKLNGEPAAGVKTLQRLSADLPDDRTVMGALATELHGVHRDTEAAAAAKVAMDGSDDPDILNNVSYMLADIKTELPLAEANARRAVHLRESATAKIGIQEANASAFYTSRNLLAVYDTLAFILFQEGKAAEAEAYQDAAWFNQQDVVTGRHLAQIKDAVGKHDEALTINELALGCEHAADDVEAYAAIKSEIERLRKAGAHSSVDNVTTALQAMRTFRVDRPAAIKGWGTFRLQLTSTGIAASELVSGSPAIRPMSTALNALKLKGAVPPGSEAKLLRDGVLSCGPVSPTCELVLMTRSGPQQEGVE